MNAVRDIKINPQKIRQFLHLSREAMGRILRVSAKTLECWEKLDGVRNPIREIGELALLVYTPEGVAAFLATPLAEFHGRTVLDLMSVRECDTVIAALAADVEGLGY
ncbi:hypothetical protein [Methylocaldum sp. SAD2]|jgi:hypothetical protein|uniref:hypothetical protein n=1 Tax=Methylocaldum sp. GT1BB TaxID=3438963 RepID=UPI000A326F07